MENHEVTTLVNITLESDLLLLGSVGLGPQPVLNVDAPVDNASGVANGLCKTRTHTGTLVTERRTEVGGGVAVELRLHGLDVLVVLPVDGCVVRETLHLGVSERVESELVTSGHHLLVDVGQVGGGVEKGSADSEESHLDVFFANDFENLLGKVGLTVVDSESERVGALAGEDQVTSLILLGDCSAGRDRGNDFDDREGDGLCGVETLERETDDAREFNVEVVDWDVDVSVLGVATGLSGIPSLREGSNLSLALAVVLLESNREGSGTSVGDVKVRSLVFGEVGTATRHLSVEGVVGVGRSDGELAAGVLESHALVTAMPVAHGVGVSVGELVNHKSSSRWVGRRRDGSRGARVGRGRRHDVLSGVSTVESHGAKGSGTRETREEDSGKLLGVEASELAEGNGVQLLGAIKSPAKVSGRRVGRFRVSRVAVVGGVELDGQSGALGSLDAKRNTGVLVLSIDTGELGVEVRVGLGNELNPVSSRLSNGD